MIFDLTYTDQAETIRYKPKNKASCRGVLKYGGEEIASLKNLAIAYTESMNLTGGQFNLEWHRMGPDDRFEGDELEIEVEYLERDNPPKHWTIPNVQLIHEGSILAIHSLAEVIGTTVIFFANKMEIE